MFQPNFCIFLYPFVKKEIVALLLNRNTEAGRLLGGSTGILEHFSAALHQMSR